MMCIVYLSVMFFFFKQKTAYEMRISDWSSDVCSSDLAAKDRIIPATKMPMPVAHFCMKKYPAKKSPSDRRPVSLCEASTTSAIIDEERIIRMIENVLLTKTSPNIHATLGLPGRPGKNPWIHAKSTEARRVGKAWVSTCKPRWA